MAEHDDARGVTRATYEVYAPRFAEQHWHADLRRGYDALARWLEPGARIIEIGCGPGRDIAQLRARGYQVTGADLSLAMLVVARERAGGDLLAADMLRLPLRSDFDAAWLAASLLHIPKAQAGDAISEVRRVLKPGGLAYISLKAGEGESWQANREGQRFFAYYSADELAASLTTCGFAVVEDWQDTVGGTTWLSVVAIKERDNE